MRFDMVEADKTEKNADTGRDTVLSACLCLEKEKFE